MGELHRRLHLENEEGEEHIAADRQGHAGADDDPHGHHHAQDEQLRHPNVGVVVQQHLKAAAPAHLVDAVGGRFDRDFGRKIFTHYEEGVEQVVQY